MSWWASRRRKALVKISTEEPGDMGLTFWNGIAELFGVVGVITSDSNDLLISSDTFPSRELTFLPVFTKLDMLASDVQDRDIVARVE